MPLSRRAFLGALGAASLGVVRELRAGVPPAAGRLAPLGLQLYTVRSLLERDLDGTLARVAEVGYREVELAGRFWREPAAFRALLARHGLVAPSSHESWDGLQRDWRRTLDGAVAAGHRWVTIPWLPEEARRTLDDWKRVAERLDRAGREAVAAGLRLAYHNHDFELAPVGGRVPLEVLVTSTDPAHVDFELDLYWLTRAGGDPLDWLRRHAGRFPMVHVKDSAGPPAHRMTDVGAGVIPWPRVLAAARKQGTRHFFVEHDDPADPIASIRASHAYLVRLEV